MMISIDGSDPNAQPPLGGNCTKCGRYYLFDEHKFCRICHRCAFNCDKCGVFILKRWQSYNEPAIPLSGFNKDRNHTIQALMDARERPSDAELDHLYSQLSENEKSEHYFARKCIKCFTDEFVQDDAKQAAMDNEFEKHLESRSDLYEQIQWTCVDCNVAQQCYVPLGFPKNALPPFDDACQDCQDKRIIKHRAKLIEQRRQELEAFRSQQHHVSSAAKDETEERYYIVEKLSRFGNLYISTHLGYFPGNKRGPNLEHTDVAKQVEICTPFVQRVVNEMIQRCEPLPDGFDQTKKEVPPSCFLVKVTVPKHRFIYTTKLPNRLWGRRFIRGFRERYDTFLCIFSDAYRKLSFNPTPVVNHKDYEYNNLIDIRSNLPSWLTQSSTTQEIGEVLSLLRPSVVPTRTNRQFLGFGSSTNDTDEPFEDILRRPSLTDPFKPEDVDFEEDKSIYQRPEMQDAIKRYAGKQVFAFNILAYIKDNSTYKKQVEWPKYNPSMLNENGVAPDSDEDDDSD